MFYCEICKDTDACERTDLPGEPILCDKCYGIEIYGVDCDHCKHSYYLRDKMYCEVGLCSPVYDV